MDKSITIRGAYGFGTQKAILFTTGNWNIADGATVGHILSSTGFNDEDIGGDYVFNPNNSTDTNIGELTFDNCIINTFRGIIRIRSKVFVHNHTINNCIVHHIGGYGVFTADTDGAGNAALISHSRTAHLQKIHAFLQTRTNSRSR
ncbi:MAG: DUF4957 domain-containing protein [Saprospiraceae bacterium]